MTSPATAASPGVRLQAAARCLLFLLCLAACLPAGLVAPAAAAAPSYREAKAGYDRLQKSARLRRYRRNWIRVIDDFKAVYRAYPRAARVAPRALYMLGRCYHELYGYSRRRADLRSARQYFQILVRDFPGSGLADDAYYHIGRIAKRLGDVAEARDAWSRVVADYPRGNMARRARAALRRLPGGGRRPRPKAAPRPAISSEVSPKLPPGAPVATIQAVRYWSGKDYTRVVLDASGQVSFRKGFLPADKANKKPPRLYLDILPAREGPDLADNLDIRDGLLRGIRLAQYRSQTVRVVFDIDDIDHTNIFYLDDPFRIVVDVFGAGSEVPEPCPVPEVTAKVAPDDDEEEDAAPGGRPIPLAQQLGLCVRRVVVDPGHGGRDPGAVGPGGLKEKDVCLRLAKKVAARLRRELGCEVILTRDRDRFVRLERRTAMANAKKADLFVSIHVNAAPNRRLRGVETYFLNLAVNEEAMRVAALENAMSTKRIADMKRLLDSILRYTKVSESSRLAAYVQSEVVRDLGQAYSGIRDLGVKQAPFIVLMGAKMPAVLAEVSFITNRTEEKRLRQGAYLDRLARGIVQGIKRYANETATAYVPARLSAVRETGRP
ncbi:tetratricopeptide repeat protein [Dissulfurirhabdus thermomarina]|uniref:Tetratricopeptide repeat protein n=1 Tax=Dissulfurirhabdus thermomarina TaxID=1765737 RepID=A0A6N9TK80_DISTH|nr:N-acetylmuramoyl-L-alanine amidase [Dissulfurirhabdus thermomarina]NDY41671.1 tetratricopeptide repeat protein [Dissulfurirhabdus thermomarina]NMX22761.1 tetratricopeptide repeat protein [Dissulfurirhabdus thermomarina]